MAECVVSSYINQFWAEVPHNPGCMLAGLGSHVAQVERRAVAGHEDAEGKRADRD